MKDTVAMNMNKLVQFLVKPAEDFTRQDIIRFIMINNIEMLNFRHVGGDGRLKSLNFAVTGEAELDRLLSAGERVDGSSLLPCIDAASSDLYIVPRYRTAFVNPFLSVPAVDILCSYYTKDGTPLASSPENTLRKAQEALRNSTGFTLEAMAELEYYVCYDSQRLYPVAAQRGYQESYPFFKWERLRGEAMQAIVQAGGKVKYGHSEVGVISDGDR
ncbi:MAG: glutamine synthetase beta-grasp domain-containing protein, partial [Dehalococcoidia bacterium]|nr:glutamine synthetase beta-grasp domain-containing protein [Dehalococcoidia bacterium]